MMIVLDCVGDKAAETLVCNMMHTTGQCTLLTNCNVHRTSPTKLHISCPKTLDFNQFEFVHMLFLE